MISRETHREWRCFQIATFAVVALVALAQQQERTMKKIMSGGQTGADRGALEAALELKFPYGGWVPKGRLAEDGQVPAEYDQLTEHSNPDYKPRSWSNVRDSTGTVIICPAPMSPGSQLTLRYCQEQGKPVMVRDAAKVISDPHTAARQVWDWIKLHKIETLNVAGTREKKCKGLQHAVAVLISDVILRAKNGNLEFVPFKATK
jgi:hypothetical protein